MGEDFSMNIRELDEIRLKRGEKPTPMGIICLYCRFAVETFRDLHDSECWHPTCDHEGSCILCMYMGECECFQEHDENQYSIENIYHDANCKDYSVRGYFPNNAISADTHVTYDEFMAQIKIDAEKQKKGDSDV